MSSIKLSPNASGTGIFTIASPNSNSNRTLDLPDNSGTLLSSSSTLAVGQLPSQFNVNSGAPSNAFAMDASGRITTPNQPAYLGVSRASSLNTGGTGTYVTWVHSTTKYNVGSHMNTSTGVFTCPIAGKYFVSTGFLTRGGGGGNTDHNVVVVLNGAQYGISARDIIVSGVGEGSTGCSGIVDAAANDAIRIDVANSSTGDFYFEWNYTSIYLIG